MKHLKFLFTALLLLYVTVASAHDFEVGGIYYSVTSTTDKKSSVTYKGSSYNEYSGEYSGDVVIPESVIYNGTTYSVTSIGDNAFRECSGFTSITIPNSVTSIGNNAFRGCNGLTSITIPNNVTFIGGSAFDSCSGLTSITIPDNITIIRGYAFAYCSGLTSVTIGNSVTSIEDSAFRECSGLTSITIPNSVTSIGNSAFRDCSGLTSITIGNSVTSIGDYSFKGCNGLKELRFEDGTGTLSLGHNVYNSSGGEGLFYDCPLETIYLGRNLSYNTDYKYGRSPFYQKHKLTSITIGNSVTSIGDNAFAYCSGLTNIIIGNSVTSIGDYAFWYCSGLTCVIIPNSVTSIGNWAFEVCSGLKHVVNLSDLNFIQGKTSYGYVAYYADNLCNVRNRIDVGDYVFNKSNGVNTLVAYLGDPNLKELTLPTNCDGENYVIGDYLLYDCKNLRSVTIGSGALSVGDNVFSIAPTKVIFLGNTRPSGIENLKGTVNYVSSAAIYGFGTEYTNLSSMFEVGGVKYVLVSAKDRTCDVIDCNYNNPVEDIVIDSLVTYRNIKLKVRNINDYAIYDNDGILTATIKNNGTIGRYAFYDCDGMLTATIENDGAIGEYAFYDCDGMLTATIENDGAIGEYAFYDCDGMQTATIENNGDIGGNAFYSCSHMQTVTIKNNGDIGGNAFYSCDGMQTATIENNGTIGDFAFYGCGGMQTAVLGNSVEAIGSYAFAECASLEEIVIPDNVPSIGSYCFNNCTSLERAIVGSGVKILNTKTFSGCSALNEVEVGKNVATIDTYVFQNCSSLPQINIPQATTKIKNNVFYNCTNLKTVIIEDKAGSLTLGCNTSSPYQLFADCKLDSVYIGCKLSYTKTSSSGFSPFYGNKYLRSVTFNDAEVAIYDDEFRGCSNLQNIVFGKGISTIGNRAFENCISLASITIPDWVTAMGSSCFAGCTAMESAKVGTGVQILNTKTFSGCSALNEVEVGKNVATIDTYVFENCVSLPQINIPQATNVINDYVFYNCKSLADVIIEDRTTVLTLGSNGSSSSSSATASTNPLFYHCPLDSVYIGGKISYKTEAEYGFSPFFRNTSLRTVVVADNETLVYDNEFYGCTGLTDVVIGDGVTSIGNWAFSGCVSLLNFSFGSKVETIGEEAFSDCTSMVKIVSSCNVPPVCGNQALADINVWDCTLYVPNDYIDAYYAAEQWWDFFFIDGAEYTVTFMIGNEKHSEATIKYGAPITLPSPTKEGYTFLGWADVPEVMPADNIVVYGSFKANDYIITYIVDGEVYETVTVACDAVVVPIEAPEKDGYIFNHWEVLPQTMPANDVEVVGVYDEIPTEVTITIGQYGSTVFSSEYALDFSDVDGLKAYAATGYNTNSGAITMTRVSTTNEGMGLYLIATPGEYKVPIIEYSNDNSLNMLVGNLEKSIVNANSDDGVYANYKYTIKSGDAAPKFYQYSDGSSISAGKAYLQIPLDWIGANESKAISLRFEDGETTDIDDIEAAEGEMKTVFDLQGRKVEEASKGIYIVNGKKVYKKY